MIPQSRQLSSFVLALAGAVVLPGIIQGGQGGAWTGVLSRGSLAAFTQAGTSPNAYLSAGDKGLFELRIYPLKQNMIANTLKFMNNVNEYQKTVGMNIVGHFPDQDAGRYIWFRTYPNEATRDQRFRATYDSDLWKSGKLRAGLTDVGLAGSNVYLATATKYSKLQPPYAATPESSVMKADAKELAKSFAASKDGEVPSCGACGSNPFIFEVTIADVKPGMMESYVRYMGEKVFPAQEAKGVRVFAQLVPYARVTSLANGGSMIPESNTFVSIRLFADEATRHQQEMSVGEDRMAAAKAAQAAGRAGLNTIVYSGHPTFYSQMQR